MRWALLGLSGWLFCMALGCHQAIPAPTGRPVSEGQQFVLVNPEIKNDFVISQWDTGRTEDGRLYVRANIQNETKGELRIQVRAVFKDDQGFKAGDETPWKYMMVPRGTWATYAETSMNTAARSFLVEIRRPQD